MGWSLIEHDFDAVAGVPVADALLLVLADRQVSPTVLSSSLFRHAPILRGKFCGVNSAFTSVSARPQRAAFSVPPAGSRRKSARGLAQPKTLREVRRPLANASASWTVHPPSRNAGLRRTGGGPPPLSIQGAAAEPVAGRMEKFFRPPSP